MYTCAHMCESVPSLSLYPFSLSHLLPSHLSTRTRTTDENRQLDSGSFTPSNELATCCSFGRFSSLLSSPIVYLLSVVSYRSLSCSLSSTWSLELFVMDVGMRYPRCV